MHEKTCLIHILWLFVAGQFSCFVLLGVLLLCLVDPSCVCVCGGGGGGGGGGPVTSYIWHSMDVRGSVFSKARYMNGVGFEILARTPVPKLPLSYPPPQPAPPSPEVDPLQQCDHPVVKEGARYFAFLCGLVNVHHGLFALPLYIIGRLFSL